MTDNPRQSKRPYMALLILLFIGVILLPGLYFAGRFLPPALAWACPSIETVNMLGRYLTFAIVAVGLDLVWGYAGILSLCQAFFFCLGGYAMGMYLAHHGGPEGIVDANGWKMPACLYVVYPGGVGQTEAEWTVPFFWKPFWSLPVTMLLALLIPGLVALVIGFFGFRSRVRGVYFAILTQAITVAAFNFFSMNNMRFCGTNGLTRFDRIAGSFQLSEPNVKLALYIITVLALAAVYWGCHGLIKSRLGRVLVAIRDDENTLRFSGYKPYVYKLFAFVLAGMIAGLAGMLYVPQMGIITPFDMEAGKSIMIVIWVAVGGRGTLAGAVLGALVVNLLYNYFTSQQDISIPGTILTFVGAIGGFVTSIMLLIPNFKKNVGWGVASLILGVPLLVFAIMHFNEVKKTFLLYIVFIVMMVVGFMLSAAGLLMWKADYWPFVLGGLFIAVVLWMKGGLMGLPGQLMRLIKGSGTGTASNEN